MRVHYGTPNGPACGTRFTHDGLTPIGDGFGQVTCARCKRSGAYVGALPQADVTRLGETWIDPENRAYPAGSLRQSRRRAYVRFPDGNLRLITIGIPDTFFSIPARPAGFVSVDGASTIRGAEFTFTPRRKD